MHACEYIFAFSLSAKELESFFFASIGSLIFLIKNKIITIESELFSLLLVVLHECFWFC